jgi:hypothetical protein
MDIKDFQPYGMRRLRMASGHTGHTHTLAIATPPPGHGTLSLNLHSMNPWKLARWNLPTQLRLTKKMDPLPA